MTPYEETMVAHDEAWHEAAKTAAVRQVIVYLVASLTFAGVVVASLVAHGPAWLTFIGGIGCLLNLVWDAMWSREAHRARQAHERSREHVVADAVTARGDS